MTGQFYRLGPWIVSAACGLAGCSAPATPPPLQDRGELHVLFPARHLRPAQAPAAAAGIRQEAPANLKLVSEYNSIQPERSLLLFDCARSGTWCADPAYAFNSIFGLATGDTSPAAATAWYNSAMFRGVNEFETTLGSWKGAPLDQAPFQLLAIVNRMDLAQWKGNSWTGAEVRFVYGALPLNGSQNAPGFTLIFEFVLPPVAGWKSFRDLGREWQKISTANGDAAVAARLKIALEKSGYKVFSDFRLRANHEVAGSAWRMWQWDLKRGVKAVPGVLTDQIRSEYSNGMVDSPAWQSVWHRAAETIGFARHIEIAEGFQQELSKVSPVEYGPNDKGMPVPPSLCGSGSDVSAIRDVLSLQQCTFCHRGETGTRFTHISNRNTGEDATLSAFLGGGSKAGGGKVLRPDLQALLSGDPVVIPAVTVTLPDSCHTGKKPERQRQFHDLARRTLFLAALLASPQPGNPAFEEARQLVDSFTTSMPH